MRRVYGGLSFTALCPVYPHGTDPTIPGVAGSPLPIRRTVQSGNISSEGGKAIVGRMDNGAGLAPTPATGSFTVANNNFATGRAVLVMGDYRLISNIDYIPGAGVNATATSVAAAINRLPGFDAVAVAAEVQVTWAEGPVDEVDFRAIHQGTVVNFTPFAPATGFLLVGRPVITSPLLSL